MQYYSDLSTKIARCEERHQLFQYRIRERIVWDYLRYPIFYMLLDRIFQKNEIPFQPEKRRAYYFQEVIGMIKSLINSVLRCLNHYDILIINYTRKAKFDGKDVNVQFYLLSKILAPHYRILLVDPSRFDERVEGNYPCDVLRSMPFHYLAKLKARFIIYKPREREILKKIGAAIQEDFGVDLDMEQVARRHFSYQIMLGRAFSRLFRRVKPKLIVHSDTATCKGWIQEAHRLKIPVVDCQHSIISSMTDILYYYTNGAASSLRDTLNDYTFTFGEYWNQFYHVPSNILAVGYPPMEARRDEVLGKNVEKTNCITVISSIHSGKSLEKLVLRLSELLPDYHIIYKLRPEEYTHWRRYYSEDLGRRDNITVVDNDDRSLYDYFAVSRYQIGINSTALIEGMTFDLVTFIYKEGWYTVMQSFIDDGAVFLITNAEEIAAKIRQNERPRRVIAVESLFKARSRDNIRQAVRQIIAAQAA